MAEEYQAEILEREFRYPKKPWSLPLVCHLWLWFLFAYHYYQQFPKEFSSLYWSIAAGYPLLVCMLLWGWPLSIFLRNKPFIISQDGISIGKKHIL